MEARSEAMDELQESGAFEDALSDKDSIDRELDELSSSREVDSELDTLKAEMGKADPEPAEESTESADLDEAVNADGEVDIDAELDDSEIEAELDELKDDK